jgi:hypothetical protein
MDIYYSKMIIRYSTVLLLIFMAACRPSTSITSEPAPGFSLTSYQRFAFMDVDASGAGLGTAYQTQVDFLQQEIARQLELRGLQAGPSEEADLLVNLGIVVDEQVQTRNTDIISDPPRYIGQRRYTWQSREVEVGRYNRGTVSVHLVDRERNELLWQGTAERVISDNPDKLREQIAKGMEKLVGSIP